MATRRAIPVAEAARLLNYGPRRLFQLMRSHGLISMNNIATRQHVEQGHLINRLTDYGIAGTTIRRQHNQVLVTDTGLALLQELIDDMGAQRQVVVAERKRPPRQRRPHRRAADLQRLGTTSGSTRAVAPPRHHD